MYSVDNKKTETTETTEKETVATSNEYSDN